MVILSGQKPFGSLLQPHKSQRYALGLLQDVYHRFVIKKSDETKHTTEITRPLITSPPSTVDLPEEITPKVVLLRRSAFFLLWTIIAIEFLFDCLLLLIRLPTMIVSLPIFTPSTMSMFFFFSFLIVTGIKLIFMLLALLKWLTTFYVIGNGEIRYRKGIINKTEKIFMSALTQEVVFTQSLLGRMLHYGTIEIYNPAIKEKIYLDTVADPQKYIEIIKSNLPKSGEGGYIIERS